MKTTQPYKGAYKDLYASNERLKSETQRMRVLNRAQLVQIAILQDEIDKINNWCHFYKSVDIEHRAYYGAV